MSKAKTPAKTKRTTVRKPTSLTPKRRVETDAGGYAYSDAVFAQALVAFRESGTVAEACRVANISRTAWYDRVETDKAFQIAVATATEEVTDDLEREAIKRAKDGSDTLVIFLLKNRRAMYAEKMKVEVADHPKFREAVAIVRSELEAEFGAERVDAAILRAQQRLVG